MNIKYISKGFILVLFLILAKASYASSAAIDSIGVENNNGKQVILHRVIAKESYYSLSRQYQVQPKDIIAFNNNKSLKIGDLIKIPTNRAFITTSATSSSQNPEPDTQDQNIQYKVGAGETLYTISKRFQVSIAEIVKENKLKNEQDIKAGQTINIPQGESITEIADEPEDINETEIIEEPSMSLPLPSNRYGLRQVDEKGIGVWMDGLNANEGNMLALHKTAPVGTVVKITNPMTHKTTFAKIVGKYTDNNNTRDAVIVISKSTADLLGILDKRFLIDISYGVPVN
ncbi:DPBB and LysM peptidoglycan-binding domain-containing protein [Albibacterium sp.]|uniref:DPBB and LysM peptidoglycan-binding domain-containing protein n=1 Tax=Albibacterium sp. TaxID=2952885 RepID=UPI002BBA6DD7|nr:LysM peptidoglycan-binding domain-containing protein [Albibacterium sp.]HUH18132.1 LysM peptidoglycan-binding domain-containing protein [Albibacterium sp.]